MYRIFQPFRLQSPSVAPTAWPVFHSRTYRRNRFDERVPPTKQGSAGVSWASPLGCRLAATIGRIEFVSLRTSRSPPDALHLPSRGRSFARLRQPGRPPTGTRTLLVQYTCNRTAPGGSPGIGLQSRLRCDRATSAAATERPLAKDYTCVYATEVRFIKGTLPISRDVSPTK
jgi:hypothetical protein